MSRDDVQTNLRLPADLKDRLQASAEENNRSLSAEAAYRLEASFSAPAADAKVFEHLFEDHLTKLYSRMETLEMRREMSRARMDSADIRLRLITREIELLKARPGHPDNELIEASAQAELGAGVREIESLLNDRKALDQAHSALLEEIHQQKAKIKEVREEAEQALADRRRLE